MADVLLTGMQWLRDQLQEHVSRSVTYARAGTGSVTIDATISVNTAEALAPGKFKTDSKQRDYIVVAADLVISSTTITPRRGDRITDGSDTYEVQSPGDNEPEYRPADAYGLMWRVHTRKV